MAAQKSGLNIENGSPFLDLLQLIQLPLTAAWARFAHFRPRLGRIEIRLPKWPSTALAGALFVDLAFSGSIVEKNAVVVGILDQTAANTNLADESGLEIVGCKPQTGRHCVDFRLIHPDVARGTCAAVATAGALEAKALPIPRLLVITAALRRFTHALCILRSLGCLENHSPPILAGSTRSALPYVAGAATRA